jgi:hypothetical protein
MSTGKQEGGLGFRDMEAFNQALLAKQAWRILQVPSSLCARVVKARYFLESSIINAMCPAGGSFTFQSILHGRDLLVEGLIWRTIGDGSKVKIHHDNWIPRKGSLRPLGQNFVHGMTHVRDLVSVQGNSWDRTKLEAMFNTDDIDDILHINIGGQPDKVLMITWCGTIQRVASSRLGQPTICAFNRRRQRLGGRNHRPQSLATKDGWAFGTPLHQIKLKSICGDYCTTG